MAIEIVTGVGRIVWGNPAKPQIKKNQQTKEVVMRDGKPVEQWVFGVAFPKAEFEPSVYAAMHQEVLSGFPSGIPGNFSWKLKDGDGVDNKGQPFANREGYAGCWILTISTEAFAPPIYKNEGGTYRQITPEEIKCGDYVVVSLNVKVNVPANATHTPGLYVNPVGIELVAYGQEIVGVGAADPNELFGGATYALPVGASQTPLAPVATAAAPYAAPAVAPAAPAVAPAVAPAAPAAAPIVAPAVAAPVLPLPATDFVANAGALPPMPLPAGR